MDLVVFFNQTIQNPVLSTGVLHLSHLCVCIIVRPVDYFGFMEYNIS